MFIFAAHKKLKASVIAGNYHRQHAASNTFVITRQCIAPAKVATVSVWDYFFATKSLSKWKKTYNKIIWYAETIFDNLGSDCLFRAFCGSLFHPLVTDQKHIC